MRAPTITRQAEETDLTQRGKAERTGHRVCVCVLLQHMFTSVYLEVVINHVEAWEHSPADFSICLGAWLAVKGNRCEQKL